MSQPTTVTPNTTTTVAGVAGPDGAVVTIGVRVTVDGAPKRPLEMATQETQTEPTEPPAKAARTDPMLFECTCVDPKHLLGPNGPYGFMFMLLPKDGALDVTPDGRWKISPDRCRRSHTMCANMEDDEFNLDEHDWDGKLVGVVLRKPLPHVVDPEDSGAWVDSEEFRTCKALVNGPDMLCVYNPEEFYRPAATYNWTEDADGHGAWKRAKCWDIRIVGYEEPRLPEYRPRLTRFNGPFARVLVRVYPGTLRPVPELGGPDVCMARTTMWPIPLPRIKPYEMLELVLRAPLDGVLIAYDTSAAMASAAFRACGALLISDEILATTMLFDYYDVVRRFAVDPATRDWKAI